MAKLFDLYSSDTMDVRFYDACAVTRQHACWLVMFLCYVHIDMPVAHCGSVMLRSQPNSLLYNSGYDVLPLSFNEAPPSAQHLMPAQQQRPPSYGPDPNALINKASSNSSRPMVYIGEHSFATSGPSSAASMMASAAYIRPGSSGPATSGTLQGHSMYQDPMQMDPGLLGPNAPGMQVGWDGWLMVMFGGG